MENAEQKALTLLQIIIEDAYSARDYPTQENICYTISNLLGIGIAPADLVSAGFSDELGDYLEAMGQSLGETTVEEIKQALKQKGGNDHETF